LLRRSSSIDGEWMDWEKERSLLDHVWDWRAWRVLGASFLLNDSGPANVTNMCGHETHRRLQSDSPTTESQPAMNYLLRDTKDITDILDPARLSAFLARDKSPGMYLTIRFVLSYLQMFQLSDTMLQ
jgi:hypothetical protein